MADNNARGRIDEQRHPRPRARSCSPVFRFVSTLAAAAIAAIAMGLPVSAQESATELPLGGLMLSGSPDLTALRIETLAATVELEKVRIQYTLSNAGAVPVSVKVAFPLPDLDFGDPDVAWAISGSAPTNFVDATVKLDGRAVAMAATQNAVLNGKTVSTDLRRSRISLVPVGNFQNELSTVGDALVGKLAADGLLRQVGNTPEGAPVYQPTWTVSTVLAGSANVPPGRTSTLELTYRTSVGVSRDTALRKGLRDRAQLKAEVERLRQTFCVEDSFFVGLDKQAGAGDANTGGIKERRIWFNLRPAIAGQTVREMRLVVDKGRADRVVSFCLDNLKKVSPTAFEMRQADSAGAVDLKVLVIGRN